MDPILHNHFEHTLRCLDDKGNFTLEEIFVNAVDEAMKKKFTGSDLGMAELAIRLNPGSGTFMVSTTDLGIDAFMAHHMARPLVVAMLEKAGYVYVYDEARLRGYITIALARFEERMPA